MKISNMIRLAALGAAAYGVYCCIRPQEHDYTELDLFDDVSEEKSDFREKLEADLKEAKSRYQ